MATWLITGSSSGLGHALALAVLERGHNAIVTARDSSRVEDLVAAYPGTAFGVSLDVAEPDQVRTAVELGIERFGRIDVLVNNAGYGYRAAIEEGEDDDVDLLFRAQFHGPVNLIKAVLPGMRSRRSGAIVNLSSIGARTMAAGSGYYSAVKAAVEGMTGPLRKELAPLGITVMVVEPGAFQTEFTGRSLTQTATVIDDYAQTAGVRRIENDHSYGNHPGDPAKGAAAIITALEADDTPELLLIGADAVEKVRAVLEEQLASIERWKSVSESTAL